MNVGMDQLLMALIFSHSKRLAGALWFLIAQIIDIIVLKIILAYTQNDKQRLIVLIGAVILVFVYEYSGVLFYMFDSAPFETRYPLGRIVECLPQAILGVVYALYIQHKPKATKMLTFVSLLAVTTLSKIVAKYYIGAPQGFGYGGVYLTAGAATICIFAINLPDMIKGKLRSVINYIGSATMGIYCMHMLIGWALNVLCPDRLWQGTLIFDMVIFVIGLVATSVIRLINLKLNWKWVSYVA